MIGLPKTSTFPVKSSKMILPVELLELILYYSKEETIINLSKISKQIDKIAKEPQFWCQRLTEGRKYDDFTFCYHYNKDEIHYHKSCIYPSTIENFPIPNRDNLTYDVKTLTELYQLAKVSSYEQFSKSNNDLAKKLVQCFEWSMHKYDIYHTFSSTIFCFYKVMLSLLSWRESCRYVGCQEDAVIFSVFCHDCKATEHPNTLLESMVNKTGSHYIHPFEKLLKRKYIEHDHIQFYYTIDGYFIVFLKDDIIYCVGKLVGDKLELGDEEIIKDKGFVCDHKYYDIFLHLNDIPNNYFNKLKGLYKDSKYGFVIGFDEDSNIPICIGKMRNNVIIALDDKDIVLANDLGLFHQSDQNLINEVSNRLTQKSLYLH